ncbi:RluA family pseudouridine synthase [Pseudanabaena sp. FACHB-1277]|uniref:RNA pseudouridylate synthase n=2 Tax=Pseudanabaena TaxID=1152 RepID=A0A926UUQ5_9CYAN|nr:RluA family pseudouridine synthase [Pseudanabaena cinerea FACHB-1277]
MILDRQLPQDSECPSYWYEGICPYSGALLRLPRTQQAEAIAQELMRELMQELEHDVYGFSTNSEGKMYGILLAKSITGEILILKAFSGLLNGKSEIAGWVPLIAGREKVAIAESITLNKLAVIKQQLIALSELPERREYALRSQVYELELQALRDRHQVSKQQRQIQRSQLMTTLTGADLAKSLQELDRESQLEKMQRRNLKRDRDQALQPLQQAIALADQQMQLLKQERRHLSQTLQTQMHQSYVITNFAGETRSLRELITTGAMPTGMGDCCAPKLLHYAATHNLEPLAMAEFWWGNPSPDGYKIQGQFYGACAERCQPLMGFLLSSRKSPPNDTKYYQTKQNQELSIKLDDTSHHQTQQNQKLSIIYEDEVLIAIAKPAGLLSVPGRYLDTQDSVCSRLKMASDRPFYPVHRLDRQTSGILLLTRDLDTLRHLQRQFHQREVNKIYEAMLSQRLNGDRGLIELPLWGNPENRPYQQVDAERGKPSATQFQVLCHEQNYTRVEFKPLTGRTHQIRVHAADARGLGIPILGDRLYGCHAVTDRLHLHARELSFTHPRSLVAIHLHCPTPY